jgi:hypothetical protein
MLYVSLPFLKGRLPFLKGHTLIPKAKIRLSFGLSKVSLGFWGEIPGQAGNDVGEIPGQARNEEERARNEGGGHRPALRQAQGPAEKAQAICLLMPNNAYLCKLKPTETKEQHI